MAQTWPVTRNKKLALKAIDAIGPALMPLLERLWPPRNDSSEAVRRILVIEPWLIGDVVLATPVLQALRERYPDAHISLLAKAHAEELLRNSGLVDDVIIADLPWTATTGKYRPSRYHRGAIAGLVSRLREARFDLTIDCRMDIRSNLVTFATGAPRRIGYAFGGGSYLLTDAVVATPDDHHKVRDWLALLRPLVEGNVANDITESLARRFKPRLSVTLDERAQAAARLRSLGFLEGDLIVGIHPGASQPRRRWPLEDFAWVAEALGDRYSSKALVFLDPDGYGEGMRLPGARFLSTSLRELMAAMTQCDLLLCNDSGPMHVADALGVPLVGIFTTGNPAWHRPFGDDQITVGQGTGHDVISYPTRDDVLRAAEERLALSGSLTAKSGRPVEHVTR
ncbi:MAG TPA: glycosyltransferase family 9 protein [Gemmatimonadaceae bacterium]